VSGTIIAMVHPEGVASLNAPAASLPEGGRSFQRHRYVHVERTCPTRV